MQLTYDSLSRVLTEVQGSNPLGTTGKTVSYTWDAESNRTKIDYPSGFDANEARDALGRITAITDSSSNTVASFDLYGAGLREKKRTLANGTYTEVSYDGFRRPTDIDHKGSGGTRFAGYAYLWNANDNPLMEKRAHTSGKGDVYSYDKVNRLVKVLRDVDDPAAELATPGTEAYVEKLEYDMDDVFNLTAYKVTPYGGSTTTTSHTTDAMNQYTAVGGVTHTYTDAGSLADDGTYLYKYDGHQHLIEVRLKSSNAVVATYTYDALGLGRRTGKTVGANTTRYVHAGQQSIEEYDGTSGTASLSRLFVFGERIDQIVAMEAPDYGDIDQDANTSEVLRFSYHTQLIGSVTQVTGPSGSVVESYEYDPYGKPTMRNGAGSVITSSAIKNPYLFTARQLDEETGLYYYRARHYSPGLRRFIQRDPLEYVDGPNAVGYGCSGPVGAVDPYGMTVERQPMARWESGDEWAPRSHYDAPPNLTSLQRETPARWLETPTHNRGDLARCAAGRAEQSPLGLLVLWPLAPPPGTVTISLPPGLSPDEIRRRIQEAGAARRWDQDTIERLIRAILAGASGVCIPVMGDDPSILPHFCVVYIAATTPNAEDQRTAVARVVWHEWCHAWVYWWLWHLFRRRLITWDDLVRIESEVTEIYDSLPERDGNRVGEVNTPLGPISVPRTDHGRIPPYGCPIGRWPWRRP